MHGERQVFVGRDARLSGESMENALIKGLTDSGINVTQLGVIATPVLYFATFQMSCPNGVMVTASHNPANYNGFKMVLQQKPLSPEQIQELYQIIQAKNFANASKGNILQREIIPDYIHHITQQIHLSRPLKIVVDAANAVAGHIAPELYRRLGCEVIELYCDLDGTFPNHHPDPSNPANLKELQQKVLEENADAGLAFDGDADRLGFVTNKGEIIYADRLLMLLSQAILKESPGETILFDVKCSKHLAEVIAEAGGNPQMSRTGHSFMKFKLKETNAALAGEMSGHIFYNDRWFGVDDAIYSGARLLEILSQRDEDADQIFAQLPNAVSTPELNITVTDADKFAIIDRVIKQAEHLDARRITIDGLRLEFADGWALMRASNTSPVLVLRVEARDDASLHRIQGIVKSLLQQADSSISLPF